VPTEECGRRDDEPVTLSVRKQANERRAEGPVGRPKLRPSMLASQHRQLVPQHDQFDLLDEFGLPTPNEQPQDSREREIGEGEQHRPMLPGLGECSLSTPFTTNRLPRPPGRPYVPRPLLVPRYSRVNLVQVNPTGRAGTTAPRVSLQETTRRQAPVRPEIRVLTPFTMSGEPR
jgi:hypothetical protein